MKKTPRNLCLLLVLAIAGCSDDGPVIPPVPSAPTIASVSPSVVSRGQENATVSILGTSLTGPTSVTMGGGITIHDVNAVSASQIDVNLSVSPGAADGPRTVTVVTGGGTASSSTAFRVLKNIAPEPSFETNPSGIVSTQITVEFDASGSDDPNGKTLKYGWDFGDGSTGVGKKTSHKYESQGEFTVQLTVEDEVGSTNSTTRKIEVGPNASPVASFVVKPGGELIEDEELEFDASSSFDPDGRITKYHWNLGNGKQVEGKVIKHTYSNPNTYNVKLVVTDNKGLSGDHEKELEVEEDPRIACTPRRGLGPDFFFNVVSSDRQKRTIIARFETDNVCNAYYQCGDIRIGGFPPRSPGPEKWVGIMCEFYDLGNGLAEIHTRSGTYWPEQGDRNFYTHPQLDCNPRDCRK